jgi:Undecaprenyl-phosphate galactose phosphotransferase WbaP
MCLPLIPFNRYVVRRLFIHLGLWGESVIIIGDLQKAHSLADYFKTRLQYGFLPTAVLSNQPRPGDLIGACPLVPICRIKVFARSLSVKTAMIIIEDLNDLGAVIKHYRDTFQWIILIKDKYENYGLTFLKPLDFMDVLGLQVKNNLLSKSTHVYKRMVDVILAFLGLLFLAPFFTLIAIMIKWESRGAVFYRQRRLGKNGKIFNLLKFRTMHQNAEEILKEQLVHNPELRKEWDRYQKLSNDPRITRGGNFLRRFSLDELPQLWNVLKGEMSLVGPRPIMVDQLELYGETIKECFQVRPGITGLWQVSGRNQTTFARRAELDLEYIQRWSIWLDIYILFKTVKIVIWHEGAY